MTLFRVKNPYAWLRNDKYCMAVVTIDPGECRYLVFKPAKAFDGQRLKRHVIRVDHVKEKEFCGILCYMEPDCVSYNLGKQARADDEKYTCELNDVTHEGNKDDLVKDQSYIYGGAEACANSRLFLTFNLLMSACLTNPCKNDAKCQSGFTDKGYRCMCSVGYKGLTCDEDIDECAAGKHICSPDAVCSNVKGSYKCECEPGYSGDGWTCEDINECATGTNDCSADAVCNNIKGSFNCACKPGYLGDGRNCIATISSCKEAFDSQKLSVDGVVILHFDSIATSVYCHVERFECGSGAWTPVMKIDGNKRTFHYDSDFWINKVEYNIPGGKTGFDHIENKLPSYWHTSFSKICLGMKIDQQLRFIVINMQADSLYSLIADGQYRATSLGRDTWKSLIGSQGSLQALCNKEGFNLEPEGAFWKDKACKARIGIFANNQNNCGDVDSRIGFGTGGPKDDNNTCGIDATGKTLDNGERRIKAMGYILNSYHQRRETVDLESEGGACGVSVKREGLNDARDLCYTSSIAFIAERGSAAIQFVDFNGTVRIKEDSVIRRTELLKYLKRFNLPVGGIVSVLRERPRKHLKDVADKIERLYQVQLTHALEKPSAICAASGDLLLCADDGRKTITQVALDYEGVTVLGKTTLVSACIINPCKNDAKCQSGFTDKGYRCICSVGYKGLTCDEDTDECATGEHNCSPDAVCRNVVGSYKCECEPGYSGDGWTCEDKISSCNEAFDSQILSVNDVVTLHFDLMPAFVFCHVGEFGCGSGAWTPVMKINGNKRTFHYDSDLWSNKVDYNLAGGETGFDHTETKLPSYWHTSFSKICLGMEINHQLRFIVINMQADSLYSLIADGQYRNTSLGRDMWKSLIGSQGSLQRHCNKEGFNLEPVTNYWKNKACKARIGIFGNNHMNCEDVDSRIGFGTGGPKDDNNTCGIDATGHTLDNGERRIKAMGYILVQ
ncbi:Fibrillin-1 [Stylophora pistillata]|uniref:Fibrillin-1 n=1 Tax=Stylophora pistillata TaxID=50429 RepID=A0A2B4S216_STYPI|nr:Fibrillin-1 [Stylophora pistillata]